MAARDPQNLAQTSTGESDLGRLDSQAFALVGITVLFLWAIPQMTGFLFFGPQGPRQVGRAAMILAVVAVVTASACVIAAVVRAVRALRIRPLAVEDHDDSAAVSAQLAAAVEDKRDDVTGGARLLATGVIVAAVGSGLAIVTALIQSAS